MRQETLFFTAATIVEFSSVIWHILGENLPTDSAIVGSGNGDGSTPLHCYAGSFATSKTECKSTVKMLVGSGCDPNAVNNKGQSIAHLAITQWVSPDMINFFSELGVDMSRKDHEGRLPIHYAATGPDMKEPD
jgi:ankyrin repeat protein